MSDTAGPDKVKQTDKVMLSSLTEKYRLAKGYKHTISSLISGGISYILGRDFRIEVSESGSYIVWCFFDNSENGVGEGGYWFPNYYNFQDKSLYPNGDLDDDIFWFFESDTDTVNFVNEGLEAKYTTTGAGAISPFTRTEYTNNIRFGANSNPISLAYFPPAILKATVRPSYRTGIISNEQTGFGLFSGEGMILYGTPCDFIGIGGYDVGCVDACPSPAGSGGSLTQNNSFEGSARIYRSNQTGSTLKVFQVQSTLDGIDVTATNVVNSGGNIRITTSDAHGYNVGDIVYMIDGTGTTVTGNGALPLTIMNLDKEGFRITAVPNATTFEIDAPDPTLWSWSFGAPWPTIQKVSSCSVNYWDSGMTFPDTDIQLAIKQSSDTEAGESEKYTFFYNLTGLEKDWNKIGPTFNQPLGHSYTKLVIGSYMGGHFNLSGSAGPYNASAKSDGTNHHTVWRKIESECVFYTKGVNWPIDIPDYNLIPIFDEEES